MLLISVCEKGDFLAINGYFIQLAVYFFYPLFMGCAFLGTGNKAKIGEIFLMSLPGQRRIFTAHAGINGMVSLNTRPAPCSNVIFSLIKWYLSHEDNGARLDNNCAA